MSKKDSAVDGAPASGEVTPAMTAVAEAVGAPDFLLTWLDRFYDEDDAELLLAAAAAAGEPAKPAGDAAGALAGFDQARLARAVRRAVLDVDEAGAHAPASLHERLEIWAMFEGWKDVPLAIRRQLGEWDVDFYAEKIRPSVEALRDGAGGHEDDYSYVLLHEAEAIINAHDHIFLWPCDCRSIIGKCRKPVDVCLRFENDRGLGWEISRERAIDILRRTDKAGLMHTAQFSGDPASGGSICNCCTDCCYPHLATEKLEARDVWPVRRYVASIDLDACTSCGRCGLRCPFEAIVCRSDGKPGFTAALCRGCGLCATGCSVDAIELVPLVAE